MKNKGFTLIELLVAMSFILATIFFINIKYIEILERKKLEKQAIVLVSRLKSNFVKCNNENIEINLIEKYIQIGSERIQLDKNFEYESKNKINTKIFKRKINDNCNLDRPFTIIIENKNKEKKEISVNSISANLSPIIEVKDGK